MLAGSAARQRVAARERIASKKAADRYRASTGSERQRRPGRTKSRWQQRKKQTSGAKAPPVFGGLSARVKLVPLPVSIVSNFCGRGLRVISSDVKIMPKHGRLEVSVLRLAVLQEFRSCADDRSQWLEH